MIYNYTIESLCGRLSEGYSNVLSNIFYTVASPSLVLTILSSTHPLSFVHLRLFHSGTSLPLSIQSQIERVPGCVVD